MITGIGIPINHSKTPRMDWYPWHTIGHVRQTVEADLRFRTIGQCAGGSFSGASGK
jgi:hypothetical protein